MRSSTGWTAAFYRSMILVSSLCLTPVGWSRAEDPCETNEFSGPVQQDYRDEYDRDSTNQKKQTWEQYWGWVKSFHEGTFLISGWTDRAKELVDGVKAGPERKKLVKDVKEFGKDLCREWAKDSSVCKVGTADLTRWGKMVEKAKKADAGDGEELGRAIARIREEYKKKVKPSSATEAGKE